MRLDSTTLLTEHLLEKIRQGLRCTPHFRLGQRLDGNCPAARLQPARDESALADIQLLPPPVVVGVALYEERVL